MKFIDHKIYLASKSTKRRELLRQMGVKFELLLLRESRGSDPAGEQVVHEGESAEQRGQRLALAKAEHAWQVLQWRRLPLRPVLAADTQVVLDEQILGRPSGPEDAARILALLSGRTHRVVTTVAVCWNDESMHVAQRSDVTFATLSNETIGNFCSRREHYDTPGGYSVEGPASTFIQKIVGSHSGILGLPMYETAQLLQKAGIPGLPI